MSHAGRQQHALVIAAVASQRTRCQQADEAQAGGRDGRGSRRREDPKDAGAQPGHVHAERKGARVAGQHHIERSRHRQGDSTSGRERQHRRRPRQRIRQFADQPEQHATHVFIGPQREHQRAPARAQQHAGQQQARRRFTATEQRARLEAAPARREQQHSQERRTAPAMRAWSTAAMQPQRPSTAPQGGHIAAISRPAPSWAEPNGRQTGASRALPAHRARPVASPNCIADSEHRLRPRKRFGTRGDTMSARSTWSGLVGIGRPAFPWTCRSGREAAASPGAPASTCRFGGCTACRHGPTAVSRFIRAAHAGRTAGSLPTIARCEPGAAPELIALARVFPCSHVRP